MNKGDIFIFLPVAPTAEYFFGRIGIMQDDYTPAHSFRMVTVPSLNNGSYSVSIKQIEKALKIVNDNKLIKLVCS